MSKLAKLRKELYLTAMRGLPETMQKDGEAVRTRRDYITYELFGSSYQDLNVRQLQIVIDYLRRQNGEQFKYLTGNIRKREYATPSQIALLRFYQIHVGFVYCNFADSKIFDEELKSVFRIQDVSQRYYERFKLGLKVPSNILAYMYSSWINPTSHRFLREGGFRRKNKNPERLYYEFLTQKEADYLISRFQQIYDQALLRHGVFSN